ncbi:MAG: endonuclease/exonuclease/phosphatase family protein [Acidobacteria bacterium]|nr:MAG: endonuclease/exonuclease/phosphatase family protein [Acidobacteriota bacterium]
MTCLIQLMLAVVVAPPAAPPPEVLRIATFNVRELSRAKLDRVDQAGRGIDPQLRSAAEIVQRVRPAVLLINEIDFDAGERINARLFIDRYLRASQNGQPPIDYPHVVFLPVNTGQPSGLDLDRDGTTSGPEDAWGFGRYPGQYGMALLSQLPLDERAVRTFQHLPWRAMPGNLMPDGTGGKPAWYGAPAAARLPLSSKSHWDVPLRWGDRVLHLLASHPTPPIFDGEEDRNGRRNFDEVRLWADYLTGGRAAAYLVDDQGRRGGLEAGAAFVILGDLNADPFNDAGPYGKPAIAQLLGHPRVQDPRPASAGGRFVERDYGGDKSLLTARFGRADYVLPSRDLEVRGAGVFWPPPGDPLRRLVDGEAAASDHHLVWVDLAWPAPSP